MKANKKNIWANVILVGMVVFVTNCYHDIHATYKLVVGDARVLKEGGVANVEIDGVPHEVPFYPDVCKVFYNESTKREETRLPCLLVYIRTDDGILAFRVGHDWIGMCASSRGSVEPIGNWIVLAEISEATFDLRDPEKGLNAPVSIHDIDGYRVYSCEGFRGYACTRLKISVPLGNFQNIGE